MKSVTQAHKYIVPLARHEMWQLHWKKSAANTGL
jgi:hypothetical protein